MFQNLGLVAWVTLTLMLGRTWAEDRPIPCQSAVQEGPAAKALLSLPAVTGVLTGTKEARPRDLWKTLAKWAPDVLVSNVLRIEQRVLAKCPTSPAWVFLLHQLQRAYLAQLGLPAGHWNEKELRLLFRGLVVLKDDTALLQKKLKALPAKPSADQMLKHLFGQHHWVEKVLVVGATDPVKVALSNFIAGLCPKACPFWDARFLYKVLITSEDGVAAYVPEVGVLVLSSTLFEPMHVLHEMVVFHELAHVATQRAKVIDGQDWLAEFQAFSGWKKINGKWKAEARPTRGSRQDRLVELSKGSAFSLAPDRVYAGKTQRWDGFATGKAYEESLSQNDPEEDLADHLALFYIQPKRFCFLGQPLAPRKFSWIAKKVYGRSAKLQCHSPSKK